MSSTEEIKTNETEKVENTENQKNENKNEDKKEKVEEEKPKEEEKKKEESIFFNIIAFNLQTFPTQDIIEPELILPTKKDLFKKLLEEEDNRTNRHYASRKLLEEKWVVLDDYLKVSLKSVESVGNYLYMMVEYYKKEVTAHTSAQTILLPSQHPIPNKPAPKKEREDSFLNAVTALHDYHKQISEKVYLF